MSSSSRKWWANIKALTSPPQHLSSHSILINDQWLDPSEFVDRLNKHYTNRSDETTLEFPQLNETKRIPRNITIPEVIRVLKAINTRKATHTEDFPQWISKLNPEAIAIPMHDIIQTMFNTGQYPALWKCSEITPLSKVASPTELKDFRPISLLHHCSKVAETFIIDHLLSHNKTDENQYAYTKGVGTTDALVNVVTLWKQAMDDKQTLAIHALFEDFSKAFDNMRPDADSLAVIMMSQGCDHPTIQLCINYLTDRQQKVIHKASMTKSEQRVSNVGVPQGTRCGPVLWNIFIQSLTTSEPIIKYADDLTVYTILKKYDSKHTSKIHKSTDGKTIASQATLIEDWCQKTGMTLNASKTKQMTISLRDKITLEITPVIINSTVIEKVASLKLLDIILDENLHFHKHLNNILM